MSSDADPTFTLAAVGDAILTRRTDPATIPGLDALAERIGAADAGFANLEVLLHDYGHPPAAESGGTYMRAPPVILDDLEAIGFDLLATATNHAGDYGVSGMRETLAHLDDRGWAHAGLGENLGTAREPAFLETPAGRVALVAACSSVTRGTHAGRQRPDVRGRPGVAPLRVETRHVVPEEDFDRIRHIADSLGLEAEKERRAELGFPATDDVDDDGDDAPDFTFLHAGGDDVQFEAGDEYRVERRVNEADHDALLKQVHAAHRQADRVLVSVHAHEGRGPRWNEETVPDFLREFARAAVDAGADAVLGHGPHVLRGIEVYEGAPICYSLGDFFMQNETVSRLPADIYERYGLDPVESSPADLYDARVYQDGDPGGDLGDPEGDRIGFLADRDFWESVVAFPQWVDGDLERVELLPVELGFEQPRPRRGTPRIASDDRAEAILDRLADRSAAFGTEVRVADGVGVVEP